MTPSHDTDTIARIRAYHAAASAFLSDPAAQDDAREWFEDHGGILDRDATGADLLAILGNLYDGGVIAFMAG